MEKLFIASDHAAFAAKTLLKEYLANRFEIIDLGADSEESTHYPIYGQKLAEAVLQSKGRGIALCGSGIGISISVNRYNGIRGSLCADTDDAKMTRLHNDSNILCLAGRKRTTSEIVAITDVWLETEFEGGRHKTRIDMLDLK